MPPLLNREQEVEALRLARSQPESLPEFSQLVARLKARVTEIALGDSRVRKRLQAVRHRVLAVDYREEKASGDVARFGDVAIYDYDGNKLIIVSIDARTGEVSAIREGTGAPPVTAEEREEAIELVVRSLTSSEPFIRSRAEVVAFPTPSYAFDSEPERRGHRGCTLYVSADRGSRVAAVTVDLCTREIVPDERLPGVLHSRPAR